MTLPPLSGELFPLPATVFAPQFLLRCRVVHAIQLQVLAERIPLRHDAGAGSGVGLELGLSFAVPLVLGPELEELLVAAAGDFRFRDVEGRVGENDDEISLNQSIGKPLLARNSPMSFGFSAAVLPTAAANSSTGI